MRRRRIGFLTMMMMRLKTQYLSSQWCNWCWRCRLWWWWWWCPGTLKKEIRFVMKIMIIFGQHFHWQGCKECGCLLNDLSKTTFFSHFYLQSLKWCLISTFATKTPSLATSLWRWVFVERFVKSGCFWKDLSKPTGCWRYPFHTNSFIQHVGKFWNVEFNTRPQESGWLMYYICL